MSTTSYRRKIGELNRLIALALNISVFHVQSAYDAQSKSSLTPRYYLQPEIAKQLGGDCDGDCAVAYPAPSLGTGLWMDLGFGQGFYVPGIHEPITEELIARVRNYPGNIGTDSLLTVYVTKESELDVEGSDWRTMRTLFWNAAQTDPSLMARYRQQVLQVPEKGNRPWY